MAKPGADWDGETLRDQVDDLLFQYWKSLPPPKLLYAMWWEGVREMLDTRHILEKEGE